MTPKFVRHVYNILPGLPNASAIAVLAMLTEQRFDDVLDELKVPPLSSFSINEYLAERGFAVLTRYASSKRPLVPWADVHYAKVRTRIEPDTDHYIVVLHSGDVLDPDSQVIRKFTDYPRTFCLTSVHRVL